MALFKAYDQKVEVNGETIMAFVEGAGVFRETAVKLLENNGIKDVKPGSWYPQQAWLDAFKDVSEKFGKNTLKLIGMSIPSNAKFPPAIDSLEKALAAIDMAYHANHRNGFIGSYKFVPVSAREVKLVCDNPYSCDFDQGIIKAMCDRFKPTNTTLVSITHSNETGCRLTGSNSCVYVVKW